MVVDSPGESGVILVGLLKAFASGQPRYPEKIRYTSRRWVVFIWEADFGVVAFIKISKNSRRM